MKLKKILLIASPIAVVLIAAVIITIILLGGSDDAYRTVKIYQLEGEAEITRASSEKISAYESMLLLADDTVKTLKDSRIYLKLDEDKYLMAGPEASFKLSATGSAENSKTKIDLEYGEIVIHVIEPLSADSSFEIGTGSSTMAVRGTSFRIYTAPDDQGVPQTMLQVFEGCVNAKLINSDGSVSEEQSFEAGKAVVIASNESETYFDQSYDGINYFEMDVATLEFLKIGFEEGKDLDIDRETLDEIIENKDRVITVTFVWGDTVFATQRVAYGSTAKSPALMPTPKGAWDFDFSTPILEDTTISWKAE